MKEAGVLYRCRVMHSRPQAPAYRFSYRLGYMLLDLDRIQELSNQLRLFSRNRWNLFAFYDKDHGPRNGSELGLWATRLLAEQGIQLDGGRIRLLCLPRVLGYAFNPISLYYCEHASGELRAIICEVHNTFGEQHCYVLDVNCGQQKAKCFHVSPLLDRSGYYLFHADSPGEHVKLGIQLFHDSSTLVLTTALVGNARPLADGQLLRQFLRLPLMTLKVTAAIHWQALKIWLRGARFHRLPPQRQPNVS